MEINPHDLKAPTATSPVFSARGLLPSDDFIRQCIHCGMCLPTCPTYTLTLREISSPRGRIRMMKNVTEGTMPLSETFMHEMFFCLDCRACETACPAGVQYGVLVEASRAAVQHEHERTGTASLLSKIVLRHLFISPTRLRALSRILFWLQRTGVFDLMVKLRVPRLFGRRMMELSSLAPRIESRFTFQRLPELLRAANEKRYRVGLLAGCVQDVAFASVNEDTAEILRHHGCEVIVPRAQVCCASLHGHTGDLDTARQLALKNIEVFESSDVEAIIVNAAGCGAFMKNYHHLFADDPMMRERAKVFSGKVKDLSEFLVGINAFTRFSLNSQRSTTYHDACHLVHGQKISKQPRALIRNVVGEGFAELQEADWCCGSAGIYNITHYETAMQLLDRKMENLRKTGARVCVTANPGCMIQLQQGVRRAGLDLEIMHLATFLRRAGDGKLTS
jgi:glycolate oxidase iron-sulfur subunit